MIYTCPQGHVGNGVGPAGCVSQGPITGPCGSAPCLNGGACQVSEIYISFSILTFGEQNWKKV